MEIIVSSLNFAIQLATHVMQHTIQRLAMFAQQLQPLWFLML
jgi:hypothetical protein